MKEVKITRYTAAFRHLALSILIFGGIFCTIIFAWYPAPHFYASGGWDGLKIAAGVDLVLGPLLTLVIFNTKKARKELTTDILLIVLLQFMALIWGVNTIYQQRPVAMVFYGNHFFSIPAIVYSNQNIPLEELQQFDEQKPVLIYAETPITSPELEEMRRRIEIDKVAPFHQLNLYQSFHASFPKLKSQPVYQANINMLIEEDAELEAELIATLAKTNTSIENYTYFRLFSNSHKIIMMFNDQGELIDYLSVPYRED